MKTTLINYKDGEIHSVGYYQTKKEATKQKYIFLRMWRIPEKVKYNIQSILS